MDFLKKAKTQVRGAVHEAHGMYSQYKEQHQQHQHQQFRQQQAYQPQHGSYSSNYYAPTSQYSSPPPQHQNHSGHASHNAFDINALGQALAPPAPPSVTRAATGCPRHEAALAEEVQFYVFKPHCLSQVRPALHPDNFAVCSSCYTSHLATHPSLAECFEPRKKDELPPDVPQTSMRALLCDMALPAVRQIFYRDCKPRNTVMPLLQFTQFALTLPECTGAGVYTEPTELFESRTAQGFGVCKACFEWYLRGTSFEHDFSRQAPVADWYCDVGNRGFAYRALMAEVLDSQSPDLKTFAAKVSQRSSVDDCAGSGESIAPANSRRPFWAYKAVDGRRGVFCQACFLDHIQGTSLERCFNYRVCLEAPDYGVLSCDLANIPSRFAMKAAARAGDQEIWRRCVTGRENLPACVGINGVDEQDLQHQSKALSQWYCFTKHPSIEICPFCYCSVVEVLGAAALCSPVRRPFKPGVIRMCFLAQASDLTADVSDRNNFENALVWRGTILRNWLHHGFDWHGQFVGLESAAATIGALPPPCITNKRALTPISGRKWYGNYYLAKDDEAKVGVRVCEDCYSECVKGTPLESFCGIDLTDSTWSQHPNGFVCNTPSKRSRAELKAACQSDDFLKFSAYWVARADCERRRKEIDALCNAQAEKQKQMLDTVNMQGQMQAIGLMQQLNAHQNAIIGGIGGSVAEAAAPDYGQRYGNSTVGYGFLTSNGAHAAQAHVDAQRFASQQQSLSAASFQPSGDTWQDTQRILALAKAVEKEWEAIF